MEKIVSDVIVIIKGSKNEIETENRLWVFLLNTIIAIIALAFERIDDELAAGMRYDGQVGVGTFGNFRFQFQLNLVLGFGGIVIHRIMRLTVQSYKK